jgi:hypothetical protein
MSSTSRRLAHLLLTCFIGALPGSMSAAEPALPLVLERTIPLTGVSGRIDHMAVDLGRKRLLVAELGNGTIDIIDLAIMQAVHRIDGLEEPQGVGYAPGADLIVVASAGDGSVRLFRGDNFSPAGTVDLGDDADNVRLDPPPANCSWATAVVDLRPLIRCSGPSSAASNSQPTPKAFSSTRSHAALS